MKIIFYIALLSVYLISSDLFITKKYNKYGVIDNNGNVIIKHTYSKIMPFNDNNHAVVYSYNDKVGVIDSANNIILDVIYTKIDEFKYDIAIIHIKNKVGLVDKSYNVLLKANYDNINYNYNDAVELVIGNKKLIISKKDLYNKLP